MRIRIKDQWQLIQTINRLAYPIVSIAVIKETSKDRKLCQISRMNEMYLEQAQTVQDWQAASDLLLDVMKDLNRKGCALWIESQLTLDALKKQYRDGELYLAKYQGILEGVVFLQEQDPYFWPETSKRDSLFLHKLAIHPRHQGSDKGKELIKLAEHQALQRKLKWLRLDCDDREPLHKFYLASGFTLVDIKNMDRFRVARYEKKIKNAANS